MAATKKINIRLLNNLIESTHESTAIIESLNKINISDLISLNMQIANNLHDLTQSLSVKAANNLTSFFNKNKFDSEEKHYLRLNKCEIYSNSLHKFSVIVTSLLGMGLSLLAPLRLEGWDVTVTVGITMAIACFSAMFLAYKNYQAMLMAKKSTETNLLHKKMHYLVVKAIYDKQAQSLDDNHAKVKKLLIQIGQNPGEFKGRGIESLINENALYTKKGLMDLIRFLDSNVSDARGKYHIAALNEMVPGLVENKEDIPNSLLGEDLSHKNPAHTFSFDQWLQKNSRHTILTGCLAVTGGTAGNFVFQGLFLNLKKSSVYEYIATPINYLDSSTGLAVFFTAAVMVGLILGGAALYCEYRSKMRRYQIDKQKNLIKMTESKIVELSDKNKHLEKIILCLESIASLELKDDISTHTAAVVPFPPSFVKKIVDRY